MNLVSAIFLCLQMTMRGEITAVVFVTALIVAKAPVRN